MTSPSSDGLRRARSRAFDAGADLYRQARPEYPPEAVAWMLDDAREPQVLDLAAGTGKLTAGLLAHGAEVTAVEPSHAMRAQLRAQFPHVRALSGTAEATGLAGASVDVVTVGQAWHWFDPARACAEITRVLRPGGLLAITWNVRDHTVDWVDEFTDIIHRGDQLAPSHGPPSLSEQFTEPDHRTFRWEQPMTPSGLRLLAASRSHLLTVPTDEREAILAEVDRLTAQHPALAGCSEFTMPYRCEVWRARVQGSGTGPGLGSDTAR